MNDTTAMSRTEWALLLLLSVLWGGSFFFSKVAVTVLPPLTIVFVRFAVAALLVFAYVRAHSIAIPTDSRRWASLVGMGLLNNLIPAGLIVWGQTMIPSGLASIVVATTPIFSILATHFTSADETLSLRKLSGMALGFIGVCVLFRLGATGTSSVSLIGIVACLGAAASYGFANALGKRFQRLGIPPAVGAMGQMTATAGIAFPLGIDGRTGGPVHRARLCDLFPHSRHRRSHQHFPCHPLNPRQCHAPRKPGSRRAGLSSSTRGYVFYHLGTDRHRWPCADLCGPDGFETTWCAKIARSPDEPDQE